MSPLVFRERPAGERAEGLLVLHHGRGADEHDLIGLADELDPDRRLHVVSPGGPLRLIGWPGKHWYEVPRTGYPDPKSFGAAYRALGAFHDELWRETGLGPESTVLGGFSMGAVMSYALGLGADRPRPAGILAFSGFMPTVDGWEPALDRRDGLPVFAAHGADDPVIGIEFGRRARDQLTDGGLRVDYTEFDGGHTIDSALVGPAAAWLAARVPAAGAGDTGGAGDQAA